MPRPGVLLVAVAISAPQPATIGGRRTANTRAPTCRSAWVVGMLVSAQYLLFGVGVSAVVGCSHSTGSA